MPLDLQAQELNEAIRSTNPFVYDLLSDKGKAIFSQRGESCHNRTGQRQKDQCHYRYCARRQWLTHGSGSLDALLI